MMNHLAFLFIIILFFQHGASFSRIFLFRRVWVVLKRTKSMCLVVHSGSFSMDSLSQLHIFWHYRDSLCVNGTNVHVFKESYKISLHCFLKCSCCRKCHPIICLEIMHNFSYKSLKRQSSNDKFH